MLIFTTLDDKLTFDPCGVRSAGKWAPIHLAISMIRDRTVLCLNDNSINRIKGLLFGQGIRGINVKRNYKTLVPADLVIDVPFPPSLPEFQRLFPDDAACAAYLERARRVAGSPIVTDDWSG